MTISGVVAQAPVLYISAGSQQFQIMSPVTDVYLGTNPESFLKEMARTRSVAISFLHPSPIGVVMKFEESGWRVFPTEDADVTFVMRNGVEYSLDSRLKNVSRQDRDFQRAIIGVGERGYSAGLTDGLNRFLFGNEEVQVYVPSQRPQCLLRTAW